MVLILMAQPVPEALQGEDGQGGRGGRGHHGEDPGQLLDAEADVPFRGALRVQPRLPLAVEQVQDPNGRRPEQPELEQPGTRNVKDCLLSVEWGLGDPLAPSVRNVMSELFIEIN